MAVIAVIDYDSGNVRSVCKAIEHVGSKAVLTSDRDTIFAADGVILPGQGSFADCMEKLRRFRLIDILKRFAESGKPFLGICVGLQLMFEKSYEFGEHEGLGIIRGSIRRFPQKKGFPVPHMGWNRVHITRKNRLFHSVDSGSYFYFVHSYFAQSDEDQIAKTDYVVEFTSAVNVDSLWGVQFHPEKSQRVGLRLLKNFCDICEGNL